MEDVNCMVCMNNKKSWDTAFCIICKDNGIICHTCIYRWAVTGNNPWICTICKSPNTTMRNIPYTLYPDVMNTIPRLLFHLTEQFQGFIVTIYGIIILLFIAFLSFTVVALSVLIIIGTIKQTLYTIEHIF